MITTILATHQHVGNVNVMVT